MFFFFANFKIKCFLFFLIKIKWVGYGLCIQINMEIHKMYTQLFRIQTDIHVL